MPVIKIYDLVTNDLLELPVAYNLRGAKAVSEYIGCSEQAVRTKIFNNDWGKSKFKAIEVGSVVHDPKAYYKLYSLEHDRSQYFKEYHKRKVRDKK